MTSQDQANNFERDIQRILKEQELVTKRSREFENRNPAVSPTTTPLICQPVMAKVGYAAVQEMARLQEEQEVPERQCLPHDTSDLSFLRFDPNSDFNKTPNLNKVSASPPKPPSGASPSSKNSKNILGKFPLEIPTPIHSPKVGLKRFGSFR